MDVPIPELKPFLSSYLTGGWKQDELALKAVFVEEERIHAQLSVVDYFMPGDGVFHFTVPLAFIWIAQLGIIYACFDNRLKEKSGEVYLREITMRCPKRITRTDSIQMDLKLVSKKRYDNMVYYTGAIDIEEGSFIGEAKFVFPLPPNFVEQP